MNITFFIGNGFDLNLGLKTGYKDFYNWIHKKYKSGNRDVKNVIYQQLFDDEANNYSNWADLELAIGNYTGNVSIENDQIFLDAKEELEQDLVDYLLEETSYVNSNIARLAQEFRASIINFCKEFNDIDRNSYKKLYESITDNITYRFVVFNYTDLIDKIIIDLNIIAENDTKKNKNMFEKPIHIHGTLFSNMILGVNDRSQIKGSHSKEFENYLIKSNLNNLLGTYNNQDVKKSIDASRYICIFGMSFGETDKIWWENIIRWLQSDQNHRLVLFVYEELNQNPSAQKKARRIEYWKKFFIGRTIVSSIVRDTIVNRIIVVLNSSIFNFQNISLNREREQTNNDQTKNANA